MKQRNRRITELEEEVARLREENERLKLAMSDQSTYVQMNWLSPYEAHGLKARIAKLERLLAVIREPRKEHDYQGLCPDSVNGWQSRDPACPECQRLVRLANASVPLEQSE